MPESSSPHFLIWVLIVVSIALVSGITYVYTNRNRRVTILFTILAVCAIALIKLISLVESELHQTFIGRYNEQHLPYMAATPGWNLLFHSWHIWILPVFSTCFIAVIIIFLIWTYKKSTPSQVEIKTPLVSVVPPKAQRLDTFMAIEAAKKEAKELHEKLSEALLANAAYEIKINDLNAQIKNLGNQLKESQKPLREEIETLNLELSAKQKENEYLANELAERSRDLVHAQTMFEKLAALHRKTQSKDGL